MIGYTYKLTLDKSPAFYIGNTTNPASRLISHRSELKRGIHGSHMFQKAWDESGSTEVYMEILFEGEQSIAQEKEVQLLQEQSSDLNLKNTCVSSAKGIDYERLQDLDKTRERKSRAVSGENNPMYGRTHTAAARAKISNANTGKPSPFKGVPMTAENKKKVSEAILRNPPVGEKNPFYGKTHSEETRKHLSEIRKGQSPTNIRKIAIDGEIFNSQSDAAKALGVSPALITHRLKNPEKYPGYQSLPPANE